MATNSNNFSSRLVRRFSPLLAACASLALSACGGGDGSLAHLRLVNLITDAPTIALNDDGTSLGTSVYGSVSAYAAARDGTHALTLSYLNPNNQTEAFAAATAAYTTFGPSVSQSLDGKTDYTVFATGTMASPHLTLVSGKDQRATVPDNDFDYQIVNAAPDAGALDVTITFPEGGIASPKDLGTITLGQGTTPTEVTLSSTSASTTTATLTGIVDLQFRNSTGTLVLDSGPIQISEQSRLMFAVIDRLGPGSTPVQLIVLNGITATPGSIISSSADSAEFNFANASPDAGLLDLIAGAPVTATYATNIAFGQQSPFVTIANTSTGTIGTPAGNHGTALFVQQLTPVANASYTIYAQGPLATVSGLLVADDRRAVPTEAHLRFLNAAPSLAFAATSDVYLVPTGTGLNFASTTHILASVSTLTYRVPSVYVAVAGGRYDAYFTTEASSTVIFGPVTVDAAAGSDQTFVLTDLSPGTLGLIPFDDARH